MSDIIDSSVDGLAGVIEEMTATIQQLEAVLDQQVERVAKLGSAIENTNQTAESLEKCRSKLAGHLALDSINAKSPNIIEWPEHHNCSDF